MDIESLKEWWVGKQVISISNAFQHDPEDDSLSVGVVLDVVAVGNGGTYAPLVQYGSDLEPKIGMSTIIEYNDELWTALKKLTARERWAFVTGVVHRFSS